MKKPVIFRSRRWVAFVVAASLLGGACGAAEPADEEILVVATTTILGDVARNLAGDAARVEVLVPVGADPHAYQPSSRQAALLQQADLVVANGLGLEEGLLDVLATGTADGANVVVIGDLLEPISYPGGAPDPHVWLDPLRMATAARLLAAELDATDGSGGWLDRGEVYAASLEKADVEIRAILDAIPADRRKLVANHDVLGYFAARYGFEVIGAIVPGGTTLSDPSSAQLASIVTEIETHEVQAIFAETLEPTTLADAVAAEAGPGVAVVELHTGSLSPPGTDADTLIKLLLSNAQLIADALS